eukprot:jgi/Ulvmu1/7645/UM038_0074.1
MLQASTHAPASKLCFNSCAVQTGHLTDGGRATAHGVPSVNAPACGNFTSYFMCSARQAPQLCELGRQLWNAGANWVLLHAAGSCSDTMYGMTGATGIEGMFSRTQRYYAWHDRCKRCGSNAPSLILKAVAIHIACMAQTLKKKFPPLLWLQSDCLAMLMSAAVE